MLFIFVTFCNIHCNAYGDLADEQLFSLVQFKNSYLEMSII